jgi:hypothetical protein
MARKRVQTEGKTMPPVAAGSELKLVRLELSPDVHRHFRVEAAKEGKSMAAMARRLVEDWVARRKAGAR